MRMKSLFRLLLKAESWYMPPYCPGPGEGYFLAVGNDWVECVPNAVNDGTEWDSVNSPAVRLVRTFLR